MAQPTSARTGTEAPCESIRATLNAALHPALAGVLLMGAVASPAATAGQPFPRPGQPFLLPDTLVISSSTYERTRGAVAALTVGTTLPDSDTTTTAATAGNNYVDSLEQRDRWTPVSA